MSTVSGVPFLGGVSWCFDGYPFYGGHPLLGGSGFTIINLKWVPFAHLFLPCMVLRSKIAAHCYQYRVARIMAASNSLSAWMHYLDQKYRKTVLVNTV